MLTLFRFSTPEDQMLMVLGFVGAVAAAFGIPMLGYFHASLLTALVNFSQARDNSTSADNTAQKNLFEEELHKFCIRCGSFSLVVFVGGYTMLLTFSVAGDHQGKLLRKWLYGCILSQEIAWHDTHPPGELMSLIQIEVNKFQDGVGEKMAFLIHFLAGFLASVGVGIFLGWELSLVLLPALPVLFVATVIISKIQEQLGKSETKAYTKAGNTAQEAINHIRTVVSFGGEEKEVKSYTEALSLAEASARNRGLINGLGAGLLWFFTYTIFAFGFWFGSSLVLRSRRNGDQFYTPGIIFNVFYNIMFGAIYLGQALPYFEVVTNARVSARKIAAILDRDRPIDSIGEQGIRLEEFKGCLRFVHVQFHYPSRNDLPILKDFNLTINAGETVALVGPSGGGKSTVFQLLLRFYDPVKGLILMDDYDVRDLNVSWYRRKIGIVAQEPVLFSGTIDENIRCGRKDSSPQEVETAAKQANIHKFITSLPMGYDTYLGGGIVSSLSGGQKQRIAIARAILKNPRILLLDEATSALDSENERLVQEALDSARINRTTVVIAHRLSTIRNAHKIVVIVDGRIVEEGTHEELMDEMGTYYDLVSAQSFPLKMQLSQSSLTLAQQRPPRAFDSFDRLDKEYQREDVEQMLVMPPALRTLPIQSKESRLSLMFQTEETTCVRSPLLRILQLSAPEWPSISAGCLASAILGLTWPLDSILAAEILGVFNSLDDIYVERQSKRLSLHFFLIAMSSSISGFFQPFMFAISGSHITRRIRTKTFAAILNQEIAWFDESRNNTGTLCSKLAVDAARIQAMTGISLGAVIQSMSCLLFCCGMSLYFHWQVTLLSSFAVPLIFITSYLQSRILVEQYSRNEILYENTWKICNETFSSIRTIAAMNNEQYLYQKFVESLPKFHWSQISVQIRCLVFGLAQGAILFCYATSWYAGGYYIMTDRNLEYKRIIKVTEMLIFGSVMVAQAIVFSPGFLTSAGVAKQVFGLWDRKTAMQSQELSFIPKRIKPRIRLNDVHFTFPTRPDVAVLKGLSVLVEPNRKVALVGESGSGKSTCIQLLQRYYDPSSGKILLDGFDIKNLDLRWYRSNISVVSQEPVLFNRSIEENIAYGDNTREIPLGEIVRAAQTANIHTFIISLPKGYTTVVGDRGCFLSGGQKQRIAIARALIRNPKILLLDEATSALDIESERLVQTALDRVGEGRTCIIIAHRLSTIQNADKIVVIHNGTNVEEGTHDDLMEKQGFYYHLNSSNR